MKKIKRKDISEKYSRIKQRKLYISLLIMVVVAFIAGILFLAIISKSNKELVNKSLETFFNSIKINKLDYVSAIINSLSSNIGINLFMWVLGISIIGIPIIIFIIFFKAFTLGFSFSSIIYFYGFKGVLLALIYIIPNLISIFIYIVVGFYSISFSKHLFSMLFQKKEVFFKKIMQRYLKILLVSTIILIICSIIETFLVPAILKMILG